MRFIIIVGATEEQVNNLQHISSTGIIRGIKDVFNEIEQLCLELTIQMTFNIQVNKDLKIKIQTLLGTTAFIELVTVISAYNMVSRFLVALDIPIESNST